MEQDNMALGYAMGRDTNGYGNGMWGRRLDGNVVHSRASWFWR